MRTVKKEALLITSIYTVYDRQAKAELEVERQYVQGQTDPEFEVERYVVLSEKQVLTQEAIFEMTPDTFFRHATSKIKE